MELVSLFPQGLVFASKLLARKLAMGCAKGTLDFREEVISGMK